MQQEGIKAIGLYKFTIRDMLVLGGRSFSYALSQDGHRILGVVKRTYEYANIVPTVARTMIADNFANASPDNSMLITHAALGTNVTTPANGDTQLGTETYRNAIASLTSSDNVVFATGFYTAGETSGTFKEAGIFSDATGTTNSGILVSHVAINVTKSSSETLTLDWTLTFN